VFGALRFLLAYLVVVGHLVGTDYVAHFGFYAVRGFFVISGYLMTAALNEVYAFDGLRFWANRALRLLPPYYVVCVATLIAVMLAPSQAALFLKFWRGSPAVSDLVANVTVLPLQFAYSPFRLVPPFWSVAVEIDMYLLLFVIVSRRLAWACIALCAGLSFQLVSSLDALGRGLDYFTAPSAVLPFAVGAVVYFVRQRGFVVGRTATAAAFVLWACNMAAGGALLPSSYIFGLGYFADTLCMAILVCGLADCRDRVSPAPLMAVDAGLGELSYFVFLSHWLAGFAASSVVPGGDQRGWALLAVATPITLAMSVAFSRLNRAVLEPLRDRIRGSAMGRPGLVWPNSPAAPAPGGIGVVPVVVRAKRP